MWLDHNSKEESPETENHSLRSIPSEREGEELCVPQHSLFALGSASCVDEMLSSFGGEPLPSKMTQSSSTRGVNSVVEFPGKTQDTDGFRAITGLI